MDEGAVCDLIHKSLVILLLRWHKFTRNHRLSAAAVAGGPKTRLPLPQLLLPIVNTLQYKLFCDRVQTELYAMDKALVRAGITSKIRFNAVGETGMQLVDFLRGEDRVRIGGDALFRVNNRSVHY